MRTVVLQLGKVAPLLHLTVVNGVLCPSEAMGCHGNATHSLKP